MSNRFSQWSPTEYVPMPVDYYQQALAVNDSQVQNQVDQAKQIMYSLRSITPTGNAAEALQQQVLSSINDDITGVGKMNLKTPEALTKINNIVNNPQYVGQLRKIYSMTEQAKKAQEAYTTAVKEGNDRNALPYLQAMTKLADQQPGDASAFDENLFRGTDAIPKYINVQEKLNDILGKIKASGGYKDASNGQWVNIVNWESVDKNKIRQAALSQLMANTDLKDQLQRNIKYDYFMSNHRDPDAALTADAETMKQGIIDSYDNTKEILALGAINKSAVAKKYGIPESHVDQFLNQQKQFLANTEGYYNLIQKNKDNPAALNQHLIMEKYVNNHVDASSDLLSYYTEKLDKKENPYGMEALKFSHALSLEDKKQKGRKEMLALKQQMSYQRIADGTYEVNIGRTGDLGETSDVAKQKLADGSWLTDVMVANGYPQDQGWAEVNNVNLPLIQGTARKLGWDGAIHNADGTSTPIDAVGYLKQAWQNQTAYTNGYINPKVDQNFIISSVLGAKSGLEIYGADGKKITDEGDKKNIFDQFRKHSKDNSAGGSAAEMALPIGTNPYNNKPAVIFTDPSDASKISYIDLPSGIGSRFTAASEIATTERNLGYDNKKMIFANGNRYQLARLPGQGNAGLFAFANSDDREIVTAAQTKINQLASSLMKKAGYSPARGIDSHFIKQAVEAINNTAQSYLKNGQERTPFVVEGIPLGVPFYVLNDIDANPQEATMLRSLRVGTLAPLRNGKGGVTDAKSLKENIYHEGFKYLPAKGKAMDLEESGTDKVSGPSTSFSITSSLYGTDDEE